MQSATLKHMKTIGIRALKQNASAVVAEVEAGEIVTITSHGRPVAKMVPIPKSRLDELEAEGRLRRATKSYDDLPPPPPRPPGVPPLSQVIQEMRDEDPR